MARRLPPIPPRVHRSLGGGAGGDEGAGAGGVGGTGGSHPLVSEAVAHPPAVPPVSDLGQHRQQTRQVISAFGEPGPMADSTHMGRARNLTEDTLRVWRPPHAQRGR